MSLYRLFFTTQLHYHRGLTQVGSRFSTANPLLQKKTSSIFSTTKISLPATHHLIFPISQPLSEFSSIHPSKQISTTGQLLFNKNKLFWLLLSIGTGFLSTSSLIEKCKADEKEDIIRAIGPNGDRLSKISEESIESILLGLRYSNTLTSLHLTNCYSPPKLSAEANYPCETTQEETLFTHRIIDIFVDVLTNNENLNLKELSLNDNWIVDEKDMIALLTALSKRYHPLKLLNLGSNKIGDTGAAIVAKMLSEHTSLEILNLGFCGIEAQGIISLADALVNNRSLKVLILSNCRFRGEDTGLTAAKKLAFALQVNTSLETLTLWNSDITEEMLHLLTKALRKNHTLKSLDLSYLKAGNWAPILRNFLKKTPALQSLTLYGDAMDSEQLQILIRSLGFNSGLTFLGIDGYSSRTREENNKILNSLIYCLKTNITLTKVSLPSDQRFEDYDEDLLNQVNASLHWNLNLTLTQSSYKELSEQSPPRSRLQP